MPRKLTIDFFHDVVCCWCFNISSRMRVLAEEFDLDIRHRSFVLQASPGEMADRWGNPAEARATILGHWSLCRDASDRPELVNVEGMARAAFDYPHGMAAARACKAAERIGGQAVHWDMFDNLQLAHLAQARDVADPEVLVEAAHAIGLDRGAFARAFADPATSRAVEIDRKEARHRQVRSIPALIVRETGARLVNGSTPDLRAQLRATLPLLPQD